jgi:large subunit ribosomal protein L29
MNVSDIRTLDDKGLLLRRQDLLGELAALKFRNGTGQLEQTAGIRGTRRSLARVNTIIRQRELDKGLAQGSLEREVGSLDGEGSVAAAFRRHMGHTSENG